MRGKLREGSQPPLTANERLTPEEWVTLEILKVMVGGLNMRNEDFTKETDTQRMRMAVRVAREGACELLHHGNGRRKH